MEDVDSYLMATLIVVHCNNIDCVGSYKNKGDSVVTTRYGVLERFGNFVQATVGDTHPPDRVVHVRNMILMWLGGYHNMSSPRSSKLFNPIIFQ